jgi:ribosome-associated protein
MTNNNPDLTLVIRGEINIEALLKIVQNQIADDKIEEITLFDLRGKSPITSYVVIGTGTSTKHISSSAEKLADKIESTYNEPQYIPMEGRNKNAQWILIDLGEIIVHLFTQEARENYNLEELYSK